MKSHYCPAEKTTLSYEGECNWCGEKEMVKYRDQFPKDYTFFEYTKADLEAAVLAEREACAKVCEEIDPVTYTFGHTRYDDAGATAYACAAAIRARSNND